MTPKLVACGRQDGTGYAAGLSSGTNGTHVLVVVLLRSGLAFERVEPNGPALAATASSTRLVAHGVECEVSAARDGIGCVPTTGVGFGVSLSARTLIVENDRTSKVVFTAHSR